MKTQESPCVWLAEGQSSQRDMLLSLQQLKSQHPLTIIASHRHQRPEILSCADLFYHEPTEKRIEFVLHHAKQHGATVLLTGRNAIDYEAYRPDFTAAKIRLLTGATQVDHLAVLEDKYRFSQICQQHHIPVAKGWLFHNLTELQSLLQQYGHLPLCVKPVTGIFAQGFWRLDTGDHHWDSFEHLYFTDHKKIHLQQFIHAYQHSQMVQQKSIVMMLMPYLAGREYSIDVVCEHGEILAAITRYKQGSVQYVGYDIEVMAVVTPLIKAFQCDGIVSVQTKADEQGQHHVLEINSRPSGGIGYTVHCGVDLTQIAFAYWAGLSNRPVLAEMIKKIQPCAVRPLMSSVKL